LKILLVAPYFKPYNNPRALRWSELVDQMLLKGHQVTVICSNFSKEMNSVIPKGLTLLPVGFNSLQEYLILKKQSSTAHGKPGKPGKLAYKLHQLFWKPYIFPDESFIWRKPALKKTLELLESENFDALITVGLPFSAHLVGKEIKEKFPDLPWLMDVGDPYALQEYHPISNPLFYKKRSRILERACLDLADRVVVTTQKMVELYHAAFEVDKNKIRVIPPLNGLVFPSNFQMETTSCFHLQLGYFGSFFKNIREPEVLLQFLKMLLNLEPGVSAKTSIHFYGEGYEKFKLEENVSSLRLPVHIHSKISRDDLLGAIEKMNILLHLGNKSDFQIPSKIAEYICSGKPFLHISQTDGDPVLPMVQGLNWCKVIHWKGLDTDLTGVAEFIAEAPKADRGLLEALRMKFGPEKLSGAYLELLFAKE
jgi:hypothetical protein